MVWQKEPGAVVRHAPVVVETITVTAQKINGHGFLTDGGAWINISKFADESACALPAVGQTVAVGLDKDGYARWIKPAAQDAPGVANNVVKLGGESVAPTPSTPAPTVNSRDAQIARMNSLGHAVAICAAGGGVPTVAEVLDVAAQLEAWILR